MGRRFAIPSTWYLYFGITHAYSDAASGLPLFSDLTTKIEELTASSARLNTEIKNLEKEVAENQAALDKATAIRQIRCTCMEGVF